MSAARRLVGHLVSAARSQDRLREPAGRAVDAVVAASRVPPPGLKPGSWARGLGARADDTPVVVVDCTGVDTGRLNHLVEQLPAVSAATGLVRFVLLVDGPQLAVGRRSGVVVEHLVDQVAWARRHDPASWPAHRALRLAQLRGTYRPHQVVELPTGDAGELHAAIRPRPRRPWPVTVTRRVLARLERLLDPPPVG
ncbi:MAG TPA: hypothetical protein VF661_09015 [Actinomycetales bacterium]